MAADPTPRWSIPDVLDRTDLGALLDELAQPATLRVGPGRRWHCPVAEHDDRRASVTMHRDRAGHERWRCWSADHRGDAIDLVMLATGRDRAGAVEWLAGRAGMHPDRPLPVRLARPAGAAPAVTVSPLVESYVTACQRVLHSRTGRGVREWLDARGFDDATVIDNRIGADPGRAVLRRARGLPYGADPAAVFPALTATGTVSYVQARYLRPEVVGRKYDNPAAAVAPHPRVAFPAARGERSGVLVVCEGLPDALTGAQAGFRTVALLGALTPDATVAARIAHHADAHGLKVAIVCDPDPAGRHATATLGTLLERIGCDATALFPPEGHDLNAWASHDPSWHHRLDQAVGRSFEITEAVGW